MQGTMRTKILPAGWLISIIIAALAGFLPDQARHAGLAPHAYDIRAVLLAWGLLTFNTVLLMGILRPATYTRSWGRAVMAMIVSFCFLVLALTGSRHSPAVSLTFTLWSMAAFFSTLGLSAISMRRALLHRYR
jgi:uncharacterized membrane protein